MERVRIITDDGSTSFRLEGWDENYHSSHGAMTESRHVFIENGLRQVKKSAIIIFEMGFGTGMNAVLAWNLADTQQLRVQYFTVEKYPLESHEFQQLNFGDQQDELFLMNQQLHQASWNEQHNFSNSFSFTKTKEDLLRMKLPDHIDLVFYDAFSPDRQPDLWTLEIFCNLFHHMTNQGILVTYSAKGQVRRDLMAAGFQVERIPGPPGKRQMIRAIKP